MRVLVSGGAVIASMAGLFIVGGATFNSLATGSILVVAVAVFGSITVLPALLVLLGTKVDRPRIPLLWRLNRRIGTGELNRWFERAIERHTPPLMEGKRLKLRYATMPKARPPTLAVFGTRAEMLAALRHEFS